MTPWPPLAERERLILMSVCRWSVEPQGRIPRSLGPVKKPGCGAVVDNQAALVAQHALKAPSCELPLPPALESSGGAPDTVTRGHLPPRINAAELTASAFQRASCRWQSFMTHVLFVLSVTASFRTRAYEDRLVYIQGSDHRRYAIGAQLSANPQTFDSVRHKVN
jgi:hypothetical protein